MRPIRFLALAMATMVLLTACSKQAAPVATNAGDSTTAGQNGDVANTAAQLRQQAEALMAKGDYPAAIEQWKALTAVESNAANWNDLSFAYLQAKQYPAAIEAGKKALDLQSRMPFALYNVGIAYLESGDACSALSYLGDSASQQPDRYEPLLAMARAEQAVYDYPEAAYYAGQASKRAGGKIDLSTLQASIERMRQGDPPADLAKSKVTLVDGDLTLYQYQESQQKFCGERPAFTLYLIGKDGKSARLPLGGIYLGGQSIVRETLPGGLTGYWLETPNHSVYVSSFSDWRLFTYKDGQLNEVLFTGGEAPVQETIRSRVKPVVSGNQITQRYYNTGNGATELVIRSELQPDLATATVVESAEQAPGVVQAISASEIVVEVIPENRGGGIPMDYVMKASLTGDTQVLKDGQPAPLSSVQAGMVVRLTRSKQRTVIELLPQSKAGGK